ncbi:sodium/potassium-transporting ATPase subunit beta-2 [Agrilus planipennis]|uniref:Sodium/potassium-transporting ATPase subunit beta-2 n=1 Tax=Agrilus planipennis TaxID=224129 RepID=A0A7F5R9N6_AGRPL|nr:sodium/potassium-transporting ATPase subunit beta-2 [Agrilus planipennis]
MRKIILFYIIFYAALIGFFAALLAVFYQTLDMKKPKWQLDKSVIGTNPGLGFRPMPPLIDVESTLIRYKYDNRGNIQYWKEQLDDFLSIYKAKKDGNRTNVESCIQGVSPAKDKVCELIIDASWKPCLPEYFYSFNSSKKGPCIFLKLNKIYGWIPEYYNSSSMPKNMPPDLQEHIRELEKNYSIHGSSEMPNVLKTVWVSCEGENPGDMENIGPVIYFPQRGFGGQYFPFLNQDNYLSPLVAVSFESPTRGVTINIECKAWAKNIYHDRVDRRGSVHFELMVDY